MTEQLVSTIFENTLVGGAFVYMLYYITKNFKLALDKNTEELGNVSQTLHKMNIRLDNIEKRMDDVEKGGGKHV